MSSPATPAPRPRPPRPPPVAAGVDPAADRTNATREPSGDGTTPDSIAGVVHTADAALPSIGTRHRSPFFVIISARPSLLQNAPASELPASRSSRGGAGASDMSAAYTFDTPARSQTNTTWRPSGDHSGLDGWRMSISCSIVSGAAERDGCVSTRLATSNDTPIADASDNVMADFMRAV